jgi:hypothetical protein
VFKGDDFKVRWKVNSKIISLIRTNFYSVIPDILDKKKDRKEPWNGKLLKLYDDW